MSADDGGDGGPGQREVAVRTFAAEFDDATHSYSEGEEERAPNYVVTPTGARVNRLFAVGVLTEVEQVNEEVLRGRVVDPTGAFVTYAGQYQPDEMAFLERTAPPAFVALTGKARTFEPEDSDRVYSSVRPESLNAVDADTRDRWVVAAAEATLHRLAVAAAALDSDLRGDALREALAAAGVRESLAAGVPVAIEEYGTTTGYLEAVRRLTTDALETVAGDRDEVRALDVAPDEGAGTPLGPLPDVDLDLAGASGGDVAPTDDTASTDGTDGSPADSAAEAAAQASETDDGATGAGATADGTDERTAVVGEAGTDDDADAETSAGGAAAATGAAVEADDASDDSGASDAAETDDVGGTDDLGDFDDDLGAFDDEGTGDDPDGTDADDESTAADDAAEGSAESDDADVAADEAGMYELDEAEREEVESEFGTEFSTGSEVDDPGEADIDVPDADDLVDDEGADADEEVDADGDEADAGAVGDAEELDEAVEREAADLVEEVETDDDEGVDDGAADVDLEDAAVELMAEMDDGDGADRAAVVSALVDDYGVDPDDADDAIEDALMSGQCYEPAEDRLKAI